MNPTERAIMMAQYAGNGQPLLDSGYVLFVIGGLAVVLVAIFGYVMIGILNIFIDWYNKQVIKKELNEEEDDIHTKT